MTTPYTFRRRKIGCAAFPPTWACYQQIHGNEDSFSESGSEAGGDSGAEQGGAEGGVEVGGAMDRVAHDMEIDVDAEATGVSDEKLASPIPTQTQEKGKQRVVDLVPRGNRIGSVHILRPILTIQRSQGFVRNQDLFNPPYIKDRLTQTSLRPPRGTTASSQPGSPPPTLPSPRRHGTPCEHLIVPVRIPLLGLTEICFGLRRPSCPSSPPWFVTGAPSAP
ncbi:hypothetical protein K438DRAFT_1986873 [Mycena galopus ATCC 62051]|nr:hypothetical protein K438DRAFT_1986873 [Mycena galopus ATCC 62051]